MNAPVAVYRFDPESTQAFPELTRVRLLEPARTEGGVEVPVGTCGTVVGVWPQGRGYEVDFAAGLATVDAAHLAAAE